MKSLLMFIKREITTKYSHEAGKERKSKNHYFCPVKCEGDKFYALAGQCPICNMELISATDIKAAICRISL